MASSSSHPTPRSRKYDVFLSFRGEDTRKTFVYNLYSALKKESIYTYKDDETLPRGDTIGPSLMNAIADSQIAIVVFSKNYANSSWCLDELEYIMKCRKERTLDVLTVFYYVEPRDVKKQKRKYEEAFAKYESENNRKVESWREALFCAGNISGWGIHHNDNGYEAKCINEIVGAVSHEVFQLNSVLDENFVGMGTRMQDLKSQLQIGSGGVRMIGIWGIGGGGKTTLASSLYIEISGKFDSCCFVRNIKEQSRKPGIEFLQGMILSAVVKTKVEVPSVEIGKQMIKRRLQKRNVLIVLDDIDDDMQLGALAGSKDWFGDGTRIIITTRDQHLLQRVDEFSQVSLLSDEDASVLFNSLAYNAKNHVVDYESLSRRVVSYAGGLPLALKVLGYFLYDKNTEEWISTLDRLKDIPEMEILKILKISYDGLKPLEKELFLDIACFCKGMKKHEAMVLLDACGVHTGIGVKVLIQKGLITICSNNYGYGKHDIFDMHDLIQEMGHYIVRGEHPNNPEKHTRLWRDEDIEDICSRNATEENNSIEGIRCYECPSDFGKFVSKAKNLRLLSFGNNNDETDIEVPRFLSNQLRYLFWRGYPSSPFPERFRLKKLVVLMLEHTLQEELWMGYKYLPCLKELHLYRADNLVRTPDFGGLPCLQKLTLSNCVNLKEIHSSLGSHSSLVYVHVSRCKKLREFPTIVQMYKLEIFEISSCIALLKFPEIEANMDNLVKLSLDHVRIEVLPSTVGKYCTKLRSLMLEECSELKSIEGNFHALKDLQKCKIRGFRKVIKLPNDLFNENTFLEELHLYSTWPPSIPHLPRFMRRLTLCGCGLKDGEIPCDISELSNLQELNLSGSHFSRLKFSLSRLSQLKLLNLERCRKLVELPELPTSIAIIKADNCSSLTFVGDINTNCKWLCEVSVRNVGSVIGGDRLLKSMLQGKAIENRCMRLQLDGLEIPKGFILPLLSGRRYLLLLPENWFIHFSGFLMCAALRKNKNTILQYISMKHDKGGMDSQQEDVYWEGSVEDVQTWVGYVSFASLKDTRWWDQTSTALEFINELDSCSGFGVKLVSKTSPVETTTSSSYESSNAYTSFFSIKHDSRSDLKCLFGSYNNR